MPLCSETRSSSDSRLQFFTRTVSLPCWTAMIDCSAVCVPPLDPFKVAAVGAGADNLDSSALTILAEEIPKPRTQIRNPHLTSAICCKCLAIIIRANCSFIKIKRRLGGGGFTNKVNACKSAQPLFSVNYFGQFSCLTGNPY